MTKPNGEIDANRTMQIDLNDVRNELELSDVDPATLAAAFTPVVERARKSHLPPPLPPIERAPDLSMAHTETGSAASLDGTSFETANGGASRAHVRGPSRGAGFYLAVIAALLVVGGIGGTVAAKLARPSATPTTTAAVTGVGMASPGQHAVANGASTVAPTATIIGIPTVEITDNAPASTAVGR